MPVSTADLARAVRVAVVVAAAAPVAAGVEQHDPPRATAGWTIR